MELRFVSPSLRRLDQAATEVLVAALAEDERPPHGIAGLVDWRLAGRISRLCQSGFATGALGEVVLVPGKPKLPFDKVLLFGVGPRAAFDEVAYRGVIQSVLGTLEDLRARSAVVELPGRHFAALSAERATSLLLELASTRPDHDLWTLIDDAEAQRVIQQLMVQERRRARGP